MLHRHLTVLLLVAGLVLTATVVPAPFTIDENNHLATVVALRAGRLTVPGTEGLPPAAALLAFDPTSHSRRIDVTPIASTAPPLYGLLALGPSFAGWRGLVACNTLAFLVILALVFSHAKRLGRRPETPWIAVALCGLGAPMIEYAQGLWPHLLSVALVLGAVVWAHRARTEGTLGLAFGAGLLGGLACGVRYQDAIVLGGLLLALLLLGRRPLASAGALGAGAALPLALSSVLNHARLGSWNPLSKGPGYLDLASLDQPGSFLSNLVTMAWARLVDYRVRPPFTEAPHALYLTPDPETGTYLIAGAVKKAWLQSSPWLVIPLLLFAIAWIRPTRRTDAVAAETRAFGLVVAPVLAIFAMVGPARTDGLCFNQRYFLELLPLAALALAWHLESYEWPTRRATLVASLVGTGLAAASLDQPSLVSSVPLGLALALLAVAALRSRAGPTALPLVTIIAAAWGAAIHLADDLPASRSMRADHLETRRLLEPVVPAGAAVLTHDLGAGPLMLSRHALLLDPSLDDAEDLDRVIDRVQARGQSLYLHLPGPIPDRLASALRGRQLHRLAEGPTVFVVGPSAPARPMSPLTNGRPGEALVPAETDPIRSTP